MANSSSYDEAILKAVNLGEDTDTTACVVGGLAGLEWDINKDWMNSLVKLDFINEIIGSIRSNDRLIGKAFIYVTLR